MSDFDEKISYLQGKLTELINHQTQFQREITEMRHELESLKSQADERVSTAPQNETFREVKSKDRIPPERGSRTKSEQEKFYLPHPSQKQDPISNEKSKDEAKPKSETKFEPTILTEPRDKSNLERFIGENLISKIGIIILAIGVAIGTRYALDNNLISPLMRIILGYFFGIVLIGLAVRSKTKYLNFSAVLLSGGMAIMYFITFFAYSFYSLISQPTAFVLMLIFTVFTVASAINYNRQVIAHIGLVGAYAIPFLLSDNSGNYTFLFAYIAILNVGILAVSIKKYWKPLFYSSYLITWLIFYVWYLSEYSAASDIYTGLFFSTAFFLIFYLTFIAYKVVSKDNIAFENVVLILSNSFIFYGFGYSMLDDRTDFANVLGMFTIANAAIHFAFSLAISRLKLPTKDLIYLTAALVLTFSTITVPIQFDGNFITLIWAAEAAILFWIGRTKAISLFESYSYPLMILATISLFKDWLTIYSDFFDKNAVLFPIFNSYFAVGLFFITAFTFIWLSHRSEKSTSVLPEDFAKAFDFAISALLLFAVYNLFRIEIGNYYQYESIKTAQGILPTNNFSMKDGSQNSDLQFFNIIWQINYTMLFLATLSFFNIKRFKKASLGFINLGLNAFITFIYLSISSVALGELRQSFLNRTGDALFDHGTFNLLIRYICYVFFAALSYASYKYVKEYFLTKHVSEKILKTVFDLSFYFSILILASVELVNWMSIFGYSNSFKLGLSILWGIYALFLIVLGITLKNFHLRIFAIVLFAITLLKLFFYDIADLDTISKTVVFISLGILLLIISFLYTKYKNLIFGEENTA